MATNISFSIELLTQNAESQLQAFRSKILDLSKSTTVSIDSKGAVQSAQALSNQFVNLKKGAQDTLNVSRNLVASLAMAGQKGTSEFRQAQLELQKATKQAKEFDKALKQADPGKLSDKLKSVSGAMMGIAGIGGAGFVIKDIASGLIELDTATARIRTLGGAAKDLAPNLKEMAIAMSKDIPIAAEQMMSATYDALSAGLPATEEGMKTFMDTAGKLAVGGGEQIGNTVNLLTSVVNSYGASVDEAAQYSDILFNTVNLGKTTIPELTQSLSQVVPTAASVGVKLQDVGAALALMTANGIPTAQATTSLNQLLAEMIKPGTELASVMKNAGVSIQSLADEGLVTTITKLNTEMASTGKISGAVFGSVEASKAFSTLSKDADKFRETFDQVSGTVGSTQSAFEEMQQSVGVQFQQVLQELKATLYELGEQALPAVKTGINVFKGAVDLIAPVMNNFGSLIKGGVIAFTAYKVSMMAMSSGVVKNFISSIASTTAGLAGQTAATGVATVATVSFKTATQALNAAMKANPIGFVIAGITALIAVTKTIIDLTHKSAEEKLDETKAYAETIQKEIDETQATRDLKSEKQQLIDEYIKLGKSSRETTEEQKRFEELQGIINKNYPELHVNTQNFNSELSGLEQTSKSLGNEITTLDGKLTKLSKNMTITLQGQFFEQANIAKGNAVEQFGKALSGQDQKRFYDALGVIYGRKTEEGINEALGKLQTLYDNFDLSKLSQEEKNYLAKGMQYAKEFANERINAYTIWDKQEAQEKQEAANKELQIQTDLYSKLTNQIGAYHKMKASAEKNQTKNSIQEQIKQANITEDQKKQLAALLKGEKDRGDKNKKNADEKHKQSIQEIEDAKRIALTNLESVKQQKQIAKESKGLQWTSADDLAIEQQRLEILQMFNEELKSFKLSPKEISDLNTEIDKSQNDIDSLIVKVRIEAEQVREELRKINLENLETNINIAISKGDYNQVVELRKELLNIKELTRDALAYDIEFMTDPVEQARALQDLQKMTSEIGQISIQLGVDVNEQDLSKITNVIDYNLAKGLAEAEFTYRREIELAGDSVAKRFIAEQNYFDAKTKLQQDYLNKSLKIEDIANSSMQSMTTALAQSLSNNLNPAKESIDELSKKLGDLGKQKTDYTNEEKNLQTSLQNRTLSTKSYVEGIINLDKKRAEEERKQSDISLRLMLTTATGFNAVAESLSQKSSEFLTQSQLQYQKNIKEQQEKSKDNIDYISALTKDNTNNLKGYAEMALGSSFASFGAMLAAGENVIEAFKKGVLGNLLQMAEQVILTYIPQIYAAFMAQLGLAGVVAATAAIGTVYAALEIAKSSIGYKAGVVNLQGEGTATSDSIPARLSRGESVITASATQRNIELLTWLNKTNRPAEEYFNNRQSVFVNQDYKESKELLAEIREMKRGINELTRQKKTLNRVEVGVEIEDKELVKRVNIEKAARLRRL